MSDVDIEDTINRIKTHKSVQGIVIVNNEGTIVRSTYNAERKEEGFNLIHNVGEIIAKTIPTLAIKARYI